VAPPTTSRSPSDSRRARKDVEKYLLEDEVAVIATRRHWAVLLDPAARSLIFFVLGGWLLLLDPRNHLTSSAGLLVLLGTLIYLGLRVGEWWMRHFIVSPRRMLLTSGIFVRTVTLLPRRRITDLTWQETFFGQILGYGTFRIESAGQHQALAKVTFLPHADELYRTISRLLFPGDAGGGDDEGEEEPPPAGPPSPAGPPPPGPPPSPGPPPPGAPPSAGPGPVPDPPPAPSDRRDTEPLPRSAPPQP
jgi:membrane protein YdbS with pleckstrin-like domain